MGRTDAIRIVQEQMRERLARRLGEQRPILARWRRPADGGFGNENAWTRLGLGILTSEGPTAPLTAKKQARPDDLVRREQ
jgi:hypothetical protein